MRKSVKTGLSALALLLVVGSVLVGAAGAATYSEVIGNETVSVDSNTESVYAELNNTDDSSVNASVEYYGIENGNETKVATHNITVGAGNTSLDKYQSVNSSKYGEYRAVVSIENTSSVDPANVSATIGTFQQVAGGGGGGFGGSVGGISVGVLALLVVGYVLLKN